MHCLLQRWEVWGCLHVPLAGIGSLCWLCAGGDLPLVCPHRQVRDLYLVGMVEVDHKRKSDSRLSTGRSSSPVPGPPVPPSSPCQSSSCPDSPPHPSFLEHGCGESCVTPVERLPL